MPPQGTGQHRAHAGHSRLPHWPACAPGPCWEMPGWPVTSPKEAGQRHVPFPAAPSHSKPGFAATASSQRSLRGAGDPTLPWDGDSSCIPPTSSRAEDKCHLVAPLGVPQCSSGPPHPQVWFIHSKGVELWDYSSAPGFLQQQEWQKPMAGRAALCLLQDPGTILKLMHGAGQSQHPPDPHRGRFALVVAGVLLQDVQGFGL